MPRLATPAEIMDQIDGLRRLAQILVRHAADADDVLQETVARALSSPPRKGPTTGAWLKQVMRNVVRRGLRDGQRREAREQRLPRPASPEPPDTRLARLEQAAALLEAMRSLTLEKREVVELRYFERLPPRAIAGRLSIPVETVKTRLKRAIAELRQALNESQGRNWPAALATSFGMTRANVGSVSVSAVSTTLGVLTMSKLAVATTLVLAVLLLGFVLLPSLRGPAPQTSEEPQEVASGAPRLLEAENGHLASPGLDGTARHSDSKTASSSVESAAASTPGASDSSTPITGTVTLTDQNGDHVPVPAGTLRLTHWDGSSGTSGTTDVADGKFSAVLEDGHRPEFDTLVVGSRVALVTSPKDAVDVPANRHFDVKARFVADTVIRVLDSVTGEDLTTVFVQRPTAWPARGFAHPGSSSEPRTGPYISPVRIAPTVNDLEAASTPVRIGAPGYSWRSIEIVGRESREHVVELVRSGSLALDVRGPSPMSKARLRLYRKRGKGWRVVAEYHVTPDQTLVAEGLAPGRYEARVEIGHYFDGPVRLGTASFAISAGERQVAAITYEDVTKPRAVPFAGTVHVPDGWDLQDFSMGLDLLGTPLLGQRQQNPFFRVGRGLTAVPNQPRTYQFDAGQVQEGRYEIKFRTLNYQLGTTLGPNGNSSLEIRIPEPATVRVDVEGEIGSGGEFLREINWHGPTPKGVRVWTLTSERRESGRVPFEFQVPTGPIFIRPTGSEYVGREQRFDIPPSGARVTLQLARAFKIQIRVMDGSKQIPWNWDWSYKVTPLDDRGEVVTHGVRSGARQVVVTHPGRYSVSLGPIEGYEPILDQEVEVGFGDETELRIDLERRR